MKSLPLAEAATSVWEEEINSKERATTSQGWKAVDFQKRFSKFC
jgi:hypothetical protein